VFYLDLRVDFSTRPVSLFSDGSTFINMCLMIYCIFDSLEDYELRMRFPVFLTCFLYVSPSSNPARSTLKSVDAAGLF
jgi:hypothetical protein